MNINLYNHARQALDWLLPRKCLRCECKLSNQFHPCCDDCYLSLPFHTNYCQQCGQAFNANEDICGKCLASPPKYDSCFCAFEYKSPISDQICAFKYNERPELAKSIAQLMCRELDECSIELPEALIPVPLHISRLRSRGFNQSKLLAVEIGKQLEIPVLTDVVVKSRATKAQAEQSLKQRQSNLKGSFALKKRTPFKSLAIVDDVVTTGSTANEIAKILKKNGVDCVSIWGVAHTL